jgi:NAD(P)-dependent dehydrogenase (short-subunit alcohol dehydrogenase family)
MPLERHLRTYDDAVSVITGAASGIGRALARELASRGSEVVLADIQIELAEAEAARIRAEGGKAQACLVDVTDAGAIEAMLQDTVRRAGRLDYLFNNAGIGIGGAFEMHTLEDWDRIIGVNLRGVIHGVHAAYPIMRAQGFGHIINTSSAGGLVPAPGVVAYAATKHAVVGLSLSLRMEAAASGIRVSVLCPGVVRTPLLSGGKFGKFYIDLSPEEMSRATERVRPMPPERFARQVLNQVAGNRAIIVVPGWWKLIWWIYRLSPGLVVPLAENQYRVAMGGRGQRPHPGAAPRAETDRSKRDHGAH